MAIKSVNKSEDFAPAQQRLMQFIRREFKPGYNHSNVSKLIGDASARQYFRYFSETGESFILAVYPEPFEPEGFPYVQVYRLFLEIGLPVPRIHALDGALGIVLQQDLGNTTLQKHFLSASASEKGRLLRRGVDYVIRIQQEGSRSLPDGYAANRMAFDEEKLSWELGFFRRHYLEKYRGMKAFDPSLNDEFQDLARTLAQGERRLCHRDFHVRNLMLSGETLYVIDFQDARWGPITYDLASLLKDSIDLGQEEIERLIEYYRDRSGIEMEAAELDRQFHRMSVQRLLKALGTYAYQIGVRENFLYEQYMAGSLHRTMVSLDALQEYPAVRSLIAGEPAHRTGSK